MEGSQFRRPVDKSQGRPPARPVGDRVTLRFESDRGHAYLYDDVSGNVFPWSDVREAVLQAELRGTLAATRAALEVSFGHRKVADAVRFIRHWRQDYGAFLRSFDEAQQCEAPQVEQLRQHVPNHSMQLLLVLTEGCNLRCRYCVYSGAYTLHRTHGTNYMSPRTALKAVDWYAEFVSPQVKRNPRRKFGLTFYGGEPLLNSATLRQTLDHARHAYPGLFAPVMTTNGTLLTEDKAAWLVEHDVQVAISIDGPEHEHDRRRIDARGAGTHRRILSNLRAIKERYPTFWRKNLTAVCVFDYHTDIEAAAAFFEQHTDVVPRPIFVNMVSGRNTTYFEALCEEDVQTFEQRFERLRRRYKQAKVEGRPTDGYSSMIVGFPVVRMLLRRRLGDRRTAMLPFSGTCVPGDKIAVGPSGKIDVCERVNGTFPLGHLDRGGLDYERIRALIAEYQQKVMNKCHRCPASRLCNICFSFVEKQGGVEAPGPMCLDVRRRSARSLADYVSILEQNPRADFAFETDVSMLEQRQLHFY